MGGLLRGQLALETTHEPPETELVSPRNGRVDAGQERELVLDLVLAGEELHCEAELEDGDAPAADLLAEFGGVVAGELADAVGELVRGAGLDREAILVLGVKLGALAVADALAHDGLDVVRHDRRDGAAAVEGPDGSLDVEVRVARVVEHVAETAAAGRVVRLVDPDAVEAGAALVGGVVAAVPDEPEVAVHRELLAEEASAAGAADELTGVEQSQFLAALIEQCCVQRFHLNLQRKVRCSVELEYHIIIVI